VSCTKEHLKDEAHPKKAEQIRNNIYELTEFLTDVLRVEHILAYIMPFL